MDNPATTTLFLRNDGTLMLVRLGHALEIRMTPAQLLQLGIDALRVAVSLDGATLPAAAEALANTALMEATPCLPLN
jgi:hypothetical protein